MIALFYIYKTKVYVYMAKIIEAENLTRISPELTKKIQSFCKCNKCKILNKPWDSLCLA
jgi:hypothetical protein